MMENFLTIVTIFFYYIRAIVLVERGTSAYAAILDIGVDGECSSLQSPKLAACSYLHRGGS